MTMLVIKYFHLLIPLFSVNYILDRIYIMGLKIDSKDQRRWPLSLNQKFV